jgi:iron(III) transport system substrate-binding protein
VVRRAIAVTVLVALGALVGLAAVGCGNDGDPLTVYTGRTESLVGPLLERFEDQTGIAVDVRYGDTNDLALLIGTEGDRSPADVYWGQSPGATAYLAGRDLLAPLPAATLAAVAPGFGDPDGRWVGVSGRERTLVYDSSAVEQSELPDSVFDLTQPRYRGRVALAPSNGSFQDFITAMRAISGEEVAERWLRDMVANDARTYANNNAIVEAVGRGEVDLGLVNHYYNYRFLAEDPSLPSRNHQFADGDVGNLVIPSSVSILASSDRQEDARAFVDFLLSEESQAYFADETFEYPLVEGVPTAAGVPPLSSLRPPAGERADGLGDIDATGRMIAASGLN